MRPPRAGVLAIGAELLRGEIVDTNAALIGQQLDAAGIPVTSHAAVPDDGPQIARALRRLLADADVVVVSGGLGPTQDDVTRSALAAGAGVALVRASGDDLESRQRDLPDGATELPNPLGTALGMRLAVGRGVVYALPGVPHELAGMLAAHVLPDLAVTFPGLAPVRRRTIRTVGLRESEVATRLAPVVEECEVAFLASGGEVRVVLTGADDALAARVRALLGTAAYDAPSLPAAVVSGLLRAGRTVACAESLTAGLLAGRLASVPGASAVLRGGVVAYATDLKASLLGVPAEVLDRDGAVSEACARAMAAGVAACCRASYGLALTGVAGPDPQEGRPPGTLCLGLAGPGGTVSATLQLPGDRERVRTYAVVAALTALHRRLQAEAAGSA